MSKLETFNLNFGPQHPSAHGVLRLILTLNGEKVIRASAHIGLLHRGTEKLIENKNWLQALPFFDRLDYVSMMCNEHLFCLAGEKSLNLLIPLRAQYIRVLFDEITRILNHLMAITTHAMDVGALTPFLWGFEEREKLMEFYERVSGARLHASFIRVGGVSSDLPRGFINDLYIFLLQFNSRIDEIEELLTNNRIWKKRLKHTGIISKQEVNQWGLSGVLLRSTGIVFDLRINCRYEIYSHLKFQTVIGKVGDCYDRFLMRVAEMRQSTKICFQIINKIPSGPIKSDNQKIITPSRKSLKLGMENLINHFKLHSSGFELRSSMFYIALEAPKGQFGVFIVANTGYKPYRCKIRAPGFFHLQAINLMTKNQNLADVVTIIGTQDIVFGEVDR